MSQYEERMAEVDALALKYPKPTTTDIPQGTIVTYYNPAAPAGFKAMAVIFLTRNGQQMSFCHADLPSVAQQKADDYWALNAKWHTPKIDKRRTTDPQARLARALDRLEQAVEMISPTETDDG